MEGDADAEEEPAEDELEFHLGQGRAEVVLEGPCSYRKVYRHGQDADKGLMVLAIEVLFDEGSLALSQNQLLESYDHWVYDEHPRAAEEHLKEDQEGGWQDVLEAAAARMFAGPLPSLRVLEQRLAHVIRRYRFCVTTLLRAGIMSHRFGVLLHSEYRQRKRFFYEKFSLWFGQIAERTLMQRCVNCEHLWLVFGLYRQLQIFQEYFQPSTQPARLEILALRNVPAEALQRECPLGLSQVLFLFFGARLLPDASMPNRFLCYPP